MKCSAVALAVLCTVVFAGAASAEDALADGPVSLAELRDSHCYVVGIVDDAAIVATSNDKVFEVPVAGGTPTMLQLPEARQGQRNHSFAVRGNQLLYKRELPMDNGTWRRVWVGTVGRGSAPPRELAEVGQYWRYTAWAAYDGHLYWADITRDEIKRVALDGTTERPTVFTTKGAVNHLRASKDGVFYTSTFSRERRERAGKYTVSCQQIGKAGARRSRRLSKETCDPPIAEIHDMALARSGLYYVRDEALRRLPLRGGKETVLHPADRSMYPPWSPPTQLAFAHDGYIVAVDVAGRKPVYRHVRRPAAWPTRLMVGGEWIYWTERDKPRKRCQLKRQRMRAGKPG